MIIFGKYVKHKKQVPDCVCVYERESIELEFL